MLMSPLDGIELPLEYPELAGRRVLVTGLTGSGALGVEIVRLLAEQRAAIVLGATEASPEIQALAEIIAPLTPDLQLFTGPFTDHDAILRFARNAMQAPGGIDVVINVAEIGEPPAGASEATIERMVTDTLAMPCLVSRVAANRMRTTLSAGTIINIVVSGKQASSRARLVAGIARAALAAFTRSEAQALAVDGIHINAIAPASGIRGSEGCLSGNPDVASLALHLASGRGSNLSGLLFEAEAG
ncbi:MAG: SDR family NAD(P)-dependent oxidoreductase [Hyphomicrobiaceae bacterium]